MRQVGIVGWAVLAGAACASAGVVLEVEQNGVFGGGPPRAVEVRAEGAWLRLDDPEAGRRTHVDREARQVWEVDVPSRRAVVRPFSAYGRLREERAARRAAQLERIAARRAAADDAERAALDRSVRDLGLRLDGREEVRVERGSPELRHLLLGGLPQPVPVTPVTLWINAAAEPVATLWVAEHLELELDPLAIYLELGMLPEPLSEALQALRGTVVAGELLLDDGALKKRVRFRLLQVQSSARVGDLTPEPGLERVASLERAAPRPAGACTHCDGPLGDEKLTLAGLPFCSRAHRAAYARARSQR